MSSLLLSVVILHVLQILADFNRLHDKPYFSDESGLLQIRMLIDKYPFIEIRMIKIEIFGYFWQILAHIWKFHDRSLPIPQKSLVITLVNFIHPYWSKKSIEDDSVMQNMYDWDIG